MKVADVFEKLMDIPCVNYERIQGGVTNETYKVETSKGKYVMRFPGKGTNEYINRSWEIQNTHRVKKLGFVPEIYYSDEETGIIISRYIEKAMPMVENDLYDPQKLKMVCDHLAKLHCADIEMVNEFNLIANKKRYMQVLRRMDVSLPMEIQEQMECLEDAMVRLFEKFPKELVPCHGDPKLNNFLLSGKTLWLIDWEYSGMADRYFDLVNMVMTDHLSVQKEMLILRQYEISSHTKINKEKYIRYKIATDFQFIFWHLIKLAQGEMVEYNEMSWRKRLDRALKNMKILEDVK